MSTMTGCSFVLDKDAIQCRVEADCASLSSTTHLVCEDSVCVDTGLGPPGCFAGTPTKEHQEQFANQCTTAKFEQFDNCMRLGLCGELDVFSFSKVPEDPGPLPAPVIPPPATRGDCANAAIDTNTTSILYITGSTNLPPLLEAVQPLLSLDGYVAVFAPQTSCKGAAAIYDGVRIFDNDKNPAFYYKDGQQVFCKLALGGNVVDVGESDVYPLSCGYQAKADVGDYTGPIQAITFVVPSRSGQTAISAEAAHVVFGLGGTAPAGTGMKDALPWTEWKSYFIRSSGTGTVQIPSRAIGVAPTAWWGIDRLSAINLVNSMETFDPMNPEKAIGILSSDFADDHRDNLRILAFQQRGQRYAYLPDSSRTARDKANVRDGHYPIWGAIHLLALLDKNNGGVPLSAGALALLKRLTVDRLEEQLVSRIIESGFVPPCAMQVTHREELGPLEVRPPGFSCGCFYDKATNNATSCRACNNDSECPTSAPACNYGFCEKE